MKEVVQGSTSATSSRPRVKACSSFSCFPEEPRKMRGLRIWTAILQGRRRGDDRAAGQRVPALVGGSPAADGAAVRVHRQRLAQKKVGQDPDPIRREGAAHGLRVKEALHTVFVACVVPPPTSMLDRRCFTWTRLRSMDRPSAVACSASTPRESNSRTPKSAIPRLHCACQQKATVLSRFR